MPFDNYTKYHHPVDNMHTLQPKHIKLNEKESEQVLNDFNIAISQLPKILSNDPCLPEGCTTGDMIRIERKDGDELNIYYRIVV